jgi:hypothetical protein
VSCGRFHTACVTESGALYTWGRGANGQLGHGDVSDQATPKRVESGLKDKIMVKVACGENHSAAVDSAGAIYTTGGTREPPLVRVILIALSRHATYGTHNTHGARRLMSLHRR